MGLTRGLARKVFSRCGCSSSTEAGNERRDGVDKHRWAAVRFHLCGDDFSSIVGEDDFTSRRHSEVTAVQSAAEPPLEEDEETHPLINQEEIEEADNKEEREHLSQEDAAVLIQSAFRGFLARKHYGQIPRSDEGYELSSNMENSSAVLRTMSTEVQPGGSVYSFSVEEESVTVIHHVQRKARTQVFRPKEEWDDSTVSSNILKMRIQSKIEASNRREKALAYAFSQQLRTCTARKRSAKSDSTEPSVGWSWLERWMAARQPESSSVRVHVGGGGGKYEASSGTQRPTIIRNRLELSREEKESCGSNDVSVNLDRVSSPSQTPKISNQSTGRSRLANTRSTGRSRLKVMRSAPRRKPVPDYRCSRRSYKVSKRTTEGEAEKEKGCKEGGEPNSVNEIKARDASEAPSDY